MLRDILLFSNIATTRKVNGFLYFVQKLPLLGKHVGDTCYRTLRLKKVLSVLVWLFRLIFLFIKSGCYVALCIALPLYLMNMDSDPAQLANHLLFGFLIFTGVLGAFSNGKLLMTTTDTYTMTRQMHMSSRRYLLHNAVYLYGLNILSLIIGFGFFMYLCSMPLWYALIAGCIYLGSHLGMEAIQMKLFLKKHTFPLHNKYFRMISHLACLGLVYGFYIADIEVPFTPILFLGYGVICIALLIYAIPTLKHYPAYPELLDGLLIEFTEILSVTQNPEAMAKAGIALEEKDYTAEELRNSKHTLHGYRYLNALFFQRHKRLIARPIKRRLQIILVITLIAIAATYLTDFTVDKDVLTLLPPTVFFMYLLNISEKVCRAMFMNCDVSLLHYGYYRQPKVILENFRIRLKALCSYNLLITLVLVLCMNLCFAMMKLPFTWSQLALFDFSLFCLSIFFSVHYLFTYYIFQPYNEEFGMKNPFFSIINGVVYIVCYSCIRLPGNLLFVAGVLIATILYVMIALLLVYRFAPKTFHLK